MLQPRQPVYTSCAPGAPNGCACMEGIDPRSCVPDKSRGLALVCTNGKWEAVEDLSCRGDGGADDMRSDVMTSPFCATCASDELCVVSHDGACGTPRPRCKKKTTACQTAICNDECNKDLCGFGPSAPYTCNGPPCPETAQFPTALHCYGPSTSYKRPSNRFHEPRARWA